MSTTFPQPSGLVCFLCFSSRSLAITALGSVLMALGFGLGLSLWCTLPWTTISIVIAFLAVGLGVDNCVWNGTRHGLCRCWLASCSSELANTFPLRTATVLLVHSRFHSLYTLVSKAGMFISLTSFTTILAFLSMIQSCLFMASVFEQCLQRYCLLCRQ